MFPIGTYKIVFIISKFSVTLFKYCVAWLHEKMLLISSIEKCNSKKFCVLIMKEQLVVHLPGLLVYFPRIVIIWYLLEEVKRPQGN